MIKKCNLTITKIRKSIKNAIDRMSDPNNRPKYFIFGLEETQERKKDFIFLFNNIPTTVKDELDYSRGGVYLIGVGKYFYDCWVSPAFLKEDDSSFSINGAYITIEKKYIKKDWKDIYLFLESIKNGVYYIYDNRGFLVELFGIANNPAEKNQFFIKILNSKKNYGLLTSVKWNRLELNDTQAKCIKDTLRRKVSFVWGPPGTGKTTTISSLAATLYINGYRVLLSAPSNNALDQLLSSTIKIIGDSEKDLSIARLGNNASDECIRFTKKHLIHEKILSYNSWEKHISSSRIVAANIAQLTLKTNDCIGKFDYVIVGEVSMISTPFLMAPVSHTSNCVVFAGDPFQLQPPVSDEDNIDNLFLQNIFMTADALSFDDKRVSLLTSQYRMQNEIGQLVSNCFYKGMLVTCTDKTPLISGINNRIIFLNTSGDVSNLKGIDGYCSRSNKQNAKISSLLISLIIKNGIKAQEIGIVTPYNAQIVETKNALLRLADGFISKKEISEITISTVHSFQGQEKRVIIYDITDNNIATSRLTANFNLINVALSRAKEQIFIIGNKEYITDARYFNKNEIELFCNVLLNCHVVNNLSEIFLNI